MPLFVRKVLTVPNPSTLGVACFETSLHTPEAEPPHNDTLAASALAMRPPQWSTGRSSKPQYEQFYNEFPAIATLFGTDDAHCTLPEWHQRAVPLVMERRAQNKQSPIKCVPSEIPENGLRQRAWYVTHTLTIVASELLGSVTAPDLLVARYTSGVPNDDDREFVLHYHTTSSMAVDDSSGPRILHVRRRYWYTTGMTPITSTMNVALCTEHSQQERVVLRATSLAAHALHERTLWLANPAGMPAVRVDSGDSTLAYAQVVGVADATNGVVGGDQVPPYVHVDAFLDAGNVMLDILSTAARDALKMGRVAFRDSIVWRNLSVAANAGRLVRFATHLDAALAYIEFLYLCQMIALPECAHAEAFDPSLRATLTTMIADKIDALREHTRIPVFARLE